MLSLLLKTTSHLTYVNKSHSDGGQYTLKPLGRKLTQIISNG